MARILPLLILIFNVWMLVDVHKKRLPQYWYYIIFLVPFGGAVYFFMHKIKDFKSGKWFSGPPSLAEIEYRYRTTPSLKNQITLARALYDAGKKDDAAHHFEMALEKDAEDVDALYGKGRCAIDRGQYDVGVPLLQKVIDKQPSYNDYEVWMDIASAQWAADERLNSLETLQALTKIRSRTDHQLALARCLIALGRNEEAKAIISKALNDYGHSPAHVRRLYRSSARQLRSLQK